MIEVWQFSKEQNATLQILADWGNKFGPIYKLSLMEYNVVVVSDPDEVFKICSREVATPKCYEAYHPLNPVEFSCMLYQL